MVPAVMLAASLAVSGGLPVDASKISVSAPTTIVEIDVGKMKGDLVRLAWSPDGSQFYLQTVERSGRGDVTVRHFLLPATGQPPKSVDAEPAWAASYWSWKSAQAAPGMPGLKIAVDQQQKRVTATATPGGGDLAKGAAGPGGGAGGGGLGGTTVSEAAGAAYQSQLVAIVTLRLKDTVVGEFTNAPALPGTTFGWGPPGSGLIAFANPDGRIVLMDDQGRKQEIPWTTAATLPGWTGDGSRLAYFERTGRKKLTLRIVTITLPTT